MRKFLIIALGVASLGAWFVPPAFGAIKASMQKKAERNMRDDFSARRNMKVAKTANGLRTVPYGTGVYKLVW
jgi:hypothetical protein